MGTLWLGASVVLQGRPVACPREHPDENFGEIWPRLPERPAGEQDRTTVRMEIRPYFTIVRFFRSLYIQEIDCELLSTPGGVLYANPRRSPRFPFIASAEITELQSEARLRARTSDLSREGCYLDTLNPLPNGTSLKIQVTHHDRDFDTTARVVHSEPHMGMGVAFEEVSAVKAQTLDKWLADLGAA